VGQGVLLPAARNRIYVATIAGVEVVAALRRRQRGGSISAAETAIALADARNDFANQYRVVNVGRHSWQTQWISPTGTP